MTDNLTCPYYFDSIRSIDSVITQVENVTRLVETCPQVCRIIIGIGNPDLTGIGLFAHYCIQATLTALLGSWILLFKHPLSISHSKLFAALTRLQHLFICFNGYAVIVIVIASFVRFSQAMSVYEAIVVPYIVYFETWMLMLNLIFRVSPEYSEIKFDRVRDVLYTSFLLFAAVANCVLIDASLGEPQGRRAVVAVLPLCPSEIGRSDAGLTSIILTYYPPIALGVYAYVTPFVGVIWLTFHEHDRPRRFAKGLLLRLDSWAASLRLLDSFEIVTGPEQILGYCSACLLVSCLFIGDFVFLLVLLPMLFIATVALYLTGRILLARGSNRRPFAMLRSDHDTDSDSLWSQLIRQAKTAKPYLWLLPSVFSFIVGPALQLKVIQHYKTALKQTLSSDYAEDRWGVGQIAAILSWMPILTELFVEIARSPWMEKQNQPAEHHLLEQTNSTNPNESSYSLEATVFMRSHHGYENIDLQPNQPKPGQFVARTTAL